MTNNKLTNGKKSLCLLPRQFLGILAIAFLSSCGGDSQDGPIDTGTTDIFLNCGREGDSPYTTNHGDSSLPSQVCGTQTQAEPIHETVARETASSVVFIRPYILNTMGERSFAAVGTGWFVAPDLVLTNRHVVTLANTQSRIGTKVEMTLFTDNLKTDSVARVDGRVIAVAREEEHPSIVERGDLALIQLDTPVTNITPLVLAPTQEPGKKVIAIGHPGTSTYFGQWHVTIGESVSCPHSLASRNIFDITVAGGMSGGPIIDEQRRVVGMTSATISILPNCTFENVDRDSDYPVLPVEIWAYPVVPKRFLSFSPNLEEIRSFLRKSFADPSLNLNREYVEEAKTYTALTEAQWPSTDRYFVDWMNISLTPTEKTNLDKLAVDSAEAVVIVYAVDRSDGSSSCAEAPIRSQGSGFFYQDDVVLTVAHILCDPLDSGSDETEASCLARWSGPAQEQEICIRTRKQEVLPGMLIGIDLQADFAAIRLARALPDYPKLALQTTPYAPDQALLAFGTGNEFTPLGLFHTILGSSRVRLNTCDSKDYESDFEVVAPGGMSGGPIIGSDGAVYSLVSTAAACFDLPDSFYRPSKLIIKNALPSKRSQDRQYGPSADRMRMKLRQWSIDN